MNWLQARDAAEPHSLSEYFEQFDQSVNGALLSLKEVNSSSWHDDTLAMSDEYSSVRAIDTYVHPSYLRIVEAVLFPLVHPIAYFRRISRGKDTKGLGLWQYCRRDWIQGAIGKSL